MIELTNEFKKQVAGALLNVRGNFTGPDSVFAKQWGLNTSIYSRLKKGEITGIIRDAQWLTIGRKLNMAPGKRSLIIAETDVYTTIKADVLFCKKHSKAMMFVDDCEIGKTTTAKDLCRILPNCFRVDASQAKTMHLLIKAIAQAIGEDCTGRYADIKADIKSSLQLMEEPIIIIDDAGDLDIKAFLELKELWNGTEGFCGWYLIGDDSLSSLIERSIKSKKPGFRALFSRFSSNYSSVTPNGHNDRLLFYQQLIEQVLYLNVTNKSLIPELVKDCMVIDKGSKQIGGLRRLESILIINEAA